MEPNDMDQFGRRLAQERPRLTPSELDDAQQRIRARARARGGAGGPRFALIAVLVCGMVLSMTGAGLAISAAGGQGNAAAVQYAGPNGPSGTSDPGGVLGVSRSGGTGDPGGSADPGGSTGAAGNPAVRRSDSQTTRQVTATTARTLPFTGYAGIVVLLVGLGLLCAGFVIRRATTGQR